MVIKYNGANRREFKGFLVQSGIRQKTIADRMSELRKHGEREFSPRLTNQFLNGHQNLYQWEIDRLNALVADLLEEMRADQAYRKGLPVCTR